MPQVKLLLLGSPRIEAGGQIVKLETRKAVALLAYLALAADNCRRDALVPLLWPEYDLSHGRAVLRRTLSALNNALPKGWLAADRETIGLRLGIDLWLDVREFHRLLAKCHDHGHTETEVCPACLPLLAQAIDLYRDDFMCGFSLADNYNFDDWQFTQVEMLRRELGGALEKLVQCDTQRHKFAAAIAAANRWLALDRLNEAAHGQLMRLYTWSGQRAAALRQYIECRDVLQGQLGIPPQPETTELYRRIETGQLAPPPALDPAWQSAAEQTPVAHTHQATASASGEDAMRVVTVLFMQLRESHLNLEDRAGHASRWQNTVQPILDQYGGRIEHWLGGSTLIVFGSDQTREDDAELALRAALEMRTGAAELGFDIAAGADTGEVYSRWNGNGTARDIGLVGSAVDAAMCLAGQAHGGQILAGETTYHLTRSAFEFSPQSLALADLGQGATYQVIRQLPKPQKARGIEGLRARLVGRDEELAKLQAILRQVVMSGEGQVVALTGEAGIGKSRLVEELRRSAPAVGLPAVRWLEGRCLEMAAVVSYGPFIDLLKQVFTWRAEDDDQQHWEQIATSIGRLADRQSLPIALLTARVGQLPGRAQEIAARLGRLMSVRTGQVSPADETPDEMQQRTFDALRDYLVALAEQQPLALVFEDLHWADNQSLAVISLLMEALARAPMLLLCVYRPGLEYGTRSLADMAKQKYAWRATEIRLRELTHRQSQQLVNGLLGNSQLAARVHDLVWRRAQGNPFYIEELMQSLISAGIVYREGVRWRSRAEFDDTLIPVSVQSVILSQMDHLDDDDRQVLQIAAVIGRVFRRSILDRVAGLGLDPAKSLRALEAHGLIYQERVLPESEFSFRHVLMQEAIYHNIVRPRRMILHRQVAEAIESLYAPNLDEYCEQLATHYERGGDITKTLAYLLQAGARAMRNYANDSAIAHLTHGLDLLKALPETPERDRQELEFLVALGVPLVLIQGHSAPQVEAAYTRAYDLCQRVGARDQLFSVLVGLRRIHQVRGQARMGAEMCRQMIDLARAGQQPMELLRALGLYGESLYWLGEFEHARDTCQQGLALCIPGQERAQILLYGNDMHTGLLNNQARALWHMGYADQARQAAQASLALSSTLGHPFTRVYSLFVTGCVFTMLREPSTVQVLGEELERIANERRFTLYQIMGRVLLGWALAAQGDDQAGIDRLRQSLTDLHRTNTGLMVTFTHALLGESLGRMGQVAEGLRSVEAGLGAAEQTGEACWVAELHRLRGELLLLDGGSTLATEDCFRRALEIARRQKARAWELRAATSLARLWQRLGQGDRARQQMQDVYDWFTEGFDTPDLQNARAVLDVL